MADGFIQVPADSVGKKVDTTELTRPDGSIVERQRFEIPGKISVQGDELRMILVELRLQSLLMAMAFGINHNLQKLRTDVMGDSDPGS